MHFVFRLLLGAGMIGVGVTAYLEAAAPPCVTVLAVMPELETAVLFDQCNGVVIYQPLPPLPHPRALLPL